MHFEEAGGAKLFSSLPSYFSDYDVDIREKERQICRYRDKTLLTIKRKKNLYLVNHVEISEKSKKAMSIYVVCTVNWL